MNNEEKILALLEQQASVLKVLTTTVETLVTEQQKTNQRLDTLEQGQADLQRGQADLQRSQAILNATVDVLATEQLKTNQRLTNLEASVADLKEDVVKLEHAVVTLEHTQKENFGALHDGFVWLRDAMQTTQTDVSDLKTRQDNQELKITWLDKLVRKKSG
jgi:chromosome segregation ATPase